MSGECLAVIGREAERVSNQGEKKKSPCKPNPGSVVPPPGGGGRARARPRRGRAARGVTGGGRAARPRSRGPTPEIRPANSARARFGGERAFSAAQGGGAPALREEGKAPRAPRLPTHPGPAGAPPGGTEPDRKPPPSSERQSWPP